MCHMILIDGCASVLFIFLIRRVQQLNNPRAVMTNHYEQCIASLENEIRSREQERVKLIEAIEGLQQQVNKIDERYQNANRTCEQMASDIHFLQDKLRGQEATLSDNKRVISNFTILNRQSQQNSSMFKNENERLMKSEAAITASLKKVAEEKKKLEKEFSEIVAKHYEELLRSQDKADKLIKEKEQLAEQLKMKEAAVSALNETVSVLTNEKVAGQAEIGRLVKSGQELNELLRKRDMALQLNNQERQRLERALADLKGLNSKKDEGTQELLKRIDEGQKLLAKLGGEKSILSQAVKDANEKCSAYEISLKALKTELAQSNEHIIQLQKEKNGVALKWTESKKQCEQLTKERQKLQSTLESIRKRNEELSTSGSSLGSELEQYREISRNLQEENQELKNFIEEREAELAQLQKRSAKQKQTNKTNIDGLQLKIKTGQTALAEKESECQLLSRTSRKTIQDLQKKLQSALKQIEQKHTHFSGHSSKLQTLYRTLQSESSATIALLESKCQQNNQTIARLQSAIAHAQQSLESNDLFEKEKEQMLHKYRQFEKTQREIVESIKLGLVEKEEEIQALEQANSTLRQQNFKFLEIESTLRRECSDLRSQASEPTRFKNKRRTYVDALPEKQAADSSSFLRGSMASEIAKKNSMSRDSKFGSQVFND